VKVASESFGTQLRRLRKRAGLTQEQLAERAKLSVNAISALERGERRYPYRHTVRVLGDALGLGDEERAVLQGAATRGGRDPAPPVPRQLPALTRAFTGRTAELARLDALAGTPSGGGADVAMVIALIDGTAGVGKTTLALAWAQRVGARFPDGQLYANLRGHDPGPPAKPSEVLNGFLRALNPGFANPPTVPERAALFRSLVNGRRVLVVLDNAASADQVRPLLPGSPSCLVVVTSRAYLTGLATDYGAARVDLGLLPPPDAVSLLRTVIGHERVTAEPEAVGQVARLCGRLPLALHLAGQRAALRPDIPLGELAAELADETRRLDVLTIGTDVSTAVRRVFQWSYRSLGHPQARMFGLVGLHPGAEISVLAAAALAGVPPTAARRLLDDLTDARLVDQAGRHRYRMHDLLRIYARERAESAFGDTERAQAVRRLVEFYLHAASLADRALHPGRRAGRGEELNQPGHPVAFSGYDEALRWCETERTNLVAITRLAAGTGLPAAAWQLPDTLWSYFFLSKHWTDWAAACRTGLEAARHAGDLTGQSRMLTGLASVHRDLRQFDEAVDRHRQALDLFRRLGDRRGEGVSLSNIGDAYLGMGRYHEALEHSRSALAIIRGTGSPYLEGIALGNMGEACLGLHRYEEALGHFTRVLGLCREIDHRHGEELTLIHLGEAYLGLGRHDDAVGWFTEALHLCRDLRDRHGEGITLKHLGTVHHAVGRPDTGHRYWREALTILECLGDPEAGGIRALLAGTAAATAQPVS